MNLDLAAQTFFNDPEGLKNFLLVHRFVHLQTGTALTAKFSVPVSTFGLDSQLAEDAWIEAMKAGAQKQKRPQPPALQDWLNVHAYMHNQSYTLLSGQGTVAPDLSVVDFTDEEQYYDWMQVHQAMHDFEYQQLNLT